MAIRKFEFDHFVAMHRKGCDLKLQQITPKGFHESITARDTPKLLKMKKLGVNVPKLTALEAQIKDLEDQRTKLRAAVCADLNAIGTSSSDWHWEDGVQRATKALVPALMAADPIGKQILAVEAKHEAFGSKLLTSGSKSIAILDEELAALGVNRNELPAVPVSM